MGLAFSIPPGIETLPPTLRNIFKEYQSDLKFPPPCTGDLSSWKENGVLLLNSSLTVKPGVSLSHALIGWNEIVSRIVLALAQRGVIAILWGKSAQKFKFHFDEGHRVVSAHPSPLSAYRGFFGSKPFSTVNQMLKTIGGKEINWYLPGDVGS